MVNAILAKREGSPLVTCPELKNRFYFRYNGPNEDTIGRMTYINDKSREREDIFAGDMGLLMEFQAWMVQLQDESGIQHID